MKELFFFACLTFTLFAAEVFFIKKTYSKDHRLLPVLVTMFCLYDFYQLAQCFTDSADIFTRLEDLLLVQGLFVLLHYILEISHIQLSKLLGVVLFVLLIGMDYFIFANFNKEYSIYKPIFFSYLCIYTITIISIALYTHIKSTLNKRDHYISSIIYLSLLVPIAAVSFRYTGSHSYNGIILTSAFTITTIIVYYLIHTDKLTDNAFYLQESIFNTSDSAFILFDTDCYYLDANAAAFRLFPEELQAIHNNKKITDYVETVKKLTNKTNIWNEITINEGYYQYQLIPIYHDSILKGYTLEVQDITKLKQETQLMENLKEKAEKQTLSKSMFLARMTHDLRSPLHAIIGTCDILNTKNDLSSDNRFLITRIKNSGSVLLELVNSILIFSKLESGKISLAHKPYSLYSMLTELSHMCLINLQTKPVEFYIDFVTPYPHEIVGDVLYVRKMFQNVLSNSVKFTESGKIGCTISCTPTNDKKHIIIKCAVEDTGGGIEEGKLPYVFKNYSSFAPETSKDGTGLGLPIVKQLAKLMRGDVTIESEYGKGTKITITFIQKLENTVMYPPALITKENLLMATANSEQNFQPSFTYPDARILLADDMKINCEVFRELLRPWQINIDFVHNGNDAIKAVKENSYELVFLDLLMPGISGTETAKIIHKTNNNIPIILFSANTGEYSTEYYQSIGIIDFLGKPVNIRNLNALLEKHIPVKYRKTNTADKVNIRYASHVNNFYKPVLQAFVKEIQPLADTLPKYAQNNLEMFRIKVHGIKSTSKQLNYSELSEQAEILEMAAKTNNTSFIDTHLNTFIAMLNETLQQTQTRLKSIESKVVKADETPEADSSVNEEVVTELLTKLREAFDNYDITKIKHLINTLSKTPLTDEMSELFEDVKNAYNDFDYEMGSSLLKNI